MLKFRYIATALFAFSASTQSLAATTILDFEDIPEGTVASNQYNGLTITGGSVLTQNLSLNTAYPPRSGRNVLFNRFDGSIGLVFTNPVTSVGGYITGLESVSLDVFEGGTLLGSITTGGCNLSGFSGCSGNTNQFLNLSFNNITSARFTTISGAANRFTLDDLTVGGTITNNAVPEPSTWAMLLLGFGVVGGAMRSAKRRPRVTVSYA